jgi:hypothetical protein
MARSRPEKYGLAQLIISKLNRLKPRPNHVTPNTGIFSLLSKPLVIAKLVF